MFKKMLVVVLCAGALTYCLGYTTQKIGLASGWNTISLNIHPNDSSASTVFGSESYFIIAKDQVGQVYWPAYDINSIGNVKCGQGYMVYTSAIDTLSSTGTLVNPTVTPIAVESGWNMIAYLPNVNMGTPTALANIVSNILIAKNNNGDVYWPEYSIDNIGTMEVGQGYTLYMNAAASLVYPSGLPKRNTALACRSLPKSRHFMLNHKTDNSAVILAKSITVNGIPVPTSSEMAIYDTKGNLVGSGAVLDGMTAFSIWGDDTTTKEKDGCTESEPLTIKLWYNNKEYTLERDNGIFTTYNKNAIITGSFSVPSKVAVKAFSLTAAIPNPFHSNTKIAFDVPSVNGGAKQQVEINVYDLKGNLVRKLINGKYAAGNYTVNWDANGEHSSALGSNVYIVQMKSNSFCSKLKLFRLK